MYLFEEGARSASDVDENLEPSVPKEFYDCLVFLGLFFSIEFVV